MASIWRPGGRLASVPALGVVFLAAVGIGYAGGCFSSGEISCSEDADCFPSQVCEGGVCRAGGDGGGATGGSDGGGTGDGGCVETESTCWDGKDNDCDGDTDCKDSDCQGRNCGKDKANHTGAKCRSISGEMECREVACCNCVDDDGDTINDYGVAEGKDAPIRERECRSDENPGCDVRSKCSDCTFDPSEEDNLDTDGSHKTGVCTGQPTEADGSCYAPKAFEKAEENTDDGKDNDCDGLTDEESNRTPGNRCPENDECNSECRKGICVHHVFVSSKKYDGTFHNQKGRLSIADGRCSTLAKNADLGGEWKAVMSASMKNARERIDIRAPVYLVGGSGERVAAGAKAFWNEELENPIDRTEGGTSLTEGTDPDGDGLLTSKPDNCPYTSNQSQIDSDGDNDGDACEGGQVWTGTNAMGKVGATSCDNWTTNDKSTLGGAGRFDKSSDKWLIYGEAKCNRERRLYCISGP